MVFECITELEKYRREQANLEARIHAIGWAGLFNGFKGKDESPLDFTDLLPFPDELKQDSRVVSDRTKAIIQKIIKNKELPPQILSTLAMLIT